MSQFKEAFQKAGYKSVEERAQEIAIRAMVKHADNAQDCVEAIWAEVSKDLELMTGLFVSERTNVFRALLNRTRQELSRRQDAGLLQRPVERRAAIVVNNRNAKIEQAIARDRDNTARGQAEEDRKYKEYLARWTNSYIGKLEINGMPVWTVTPRTAKLHAQSQGRRWKCVEILCEGLPDDGRPIEYYRKPEEVAEIFQRLSDAKAA